MFRKYGRWLKLTIKPAKLKSKSSGSAVVEINHCLYFLGGIANMQMWNFRYITNFKKDAFKKLNVLIQIRPQVGLFIFGINEVTTPMKF